MPIAKTPAADIEAAAVPTEYVPAEGRVFVTVNKFGAGKISTGEIGPDNKNTYFARGERYETNIDSANALEELKYAEIDE